MFFLFLFFEKGFLSRNCTFALSWTTPPGVAASQGSQLAGELSPSVLEELVPLGSGIPGSAT